MDISTLFSTLQKQGYLTAGALKLPAQNVLGSNGIAALLGTTEFYPLQTLTLTLTGEPKVDAVSITLEGTFEQSFLGQENPGSTVVFYIDGQSTPQLDHFVHLPASWTFAASFTSLKGTVLEKVGYTSADFVLASAANTPPHGSVALETGLNFNGIPSLSSDALSGLSWLWNAVRSKLALSGAVGLPSGGSSVPVFTLSTPQLSTGFALGSIAFSAALIAQSKAGDGGDAAASIGVASTLQISPNLKPIGVSGSFDDPLAQQLTLVAGSADRPFANVNDLAALANGSALSALIPSQFPLGDHLSLVDVGITMLLDPRGGTVVMVQAAVGLTGMDWTIVPPDLVQFKGIVATFTVTNPLDPKSLKVGVDVDSVFGLGKSAEISLGALFPDLTFYGGLKSGKIDVLSAIEHFFGNTPSLGKTLDIDKLSFSVNPNDKTYTLNAHVEADATLEVPIGTDLPLKVISLRALTLALSRAQTSFSALVGADLTFLNTDWTVAAARQNGQTGWNFTGSLQSPIVLSDLIDPNHGILPQSWALAIPSFVSLPTITQLDASFYTADKTFSVAGAMTWTITLIPKELEFELDASVAVSSSRNAQTQATQYSGNVRSDLKINSIELEVEYSFAPNSTQLTFIFKEIKATYSSNTGDPLGPFIAVDFGNTSVGGILEYLIGLASPGGDAKLPAPWNALNAISLNGLNVTVYFKTGSISVSYPIELNLGFIDIHKIGFAYQRLYGQGNVQLILDCDFLGQTYRGNNALQWNPAKESPPALPGAGAAAFDLQYLGLGQHVSIRTDKPMSTVEDVMSVLTGALQPVGDPNGNPLAQLPALAFDAGSNWLIGAQFTISGTFSMSLIFNDPNVYGLLIRMAGQKAGIFAGLKFEILYRKITDSIGVYHIELNLPDAMRHLEFGEVSITLPNVTLDIYTNGDFRVDLGFPPSLTDYARCFSVQVLPFVGYGGVYFAKLDGQTSTSVPKIDNGRFDPVIEFGLALFVGIGKTISMGILSGGISITVNGIVEGVYADFEPTDRNLPSAKFFELVGTIAIVGKVFASVDFGIIQASVSLTVYASVTLEIATYEPIILEIEAGVDVSVGIKIVFITIHFHFSATVRERFVIGSASTPPWHAVSDTSDRSRLRGQRTLRRPRRLRGLTQRPRVRASHPVRRLAQSTAVAAAANPPEKIQLLCTPVVTKAQQTDLTIPSTGTGPDLVAIALMLFVPTAIDPSASTLREAMLATPNAQQADFNRLAARLLQRIIGASGTVTADDLEQIHLDLREESAFATYFQYKDVSDWLAANVEFDIDARPTSGEVSAAFFPMIPELLLKTPDYSFDFGTGRTMTAAQESWLAQYFSDLAMQYQKEHAGDGNAPMRAQSPDDTQESIAKFLFRRYFYMLSQNVVQAAIDFLRKYTYTVQDPRTESLNFIAGKFEAQTAVYMARKGDTFSAIAAEFGLHEYDLLAANAHVNGPYMAPGTQVFVARQVTARDIVAANASTTGLLRPWSSTKLAADLADAAPQRPVLSNVRYQVSAGDTFGGTGSQSIAWRFGITSDALAEQNLDEEGLFASGASIAIGDLTYMLRAGDTLQSVAAYYGTTPAQVLANNPTPELALSAIPQQQLVIQTQTGGQRYTVVAGDTLQGVARSLGVTLDSILERNSAIALAAGRALQLPGVAFTATGTFTAAYMTTTGDTLDAILTRYFGTPSPSLENLLEQFNPTVDFKNLQAGTLVRFPYALTLRNLTHYYAIDLSALLSATNLGNAKLLAPNAILVIPPFAPPITENDSFTSLGQRFNLTLDELADQLGPIEGLFREPYPLAVQSGSKAVQLTIPNIPAMDANQLITELSGSEKMNQSAAMTSRFLLDGLRVPDPREHAFTALFASAERAPAASAALQTYPLFSLVGQEFTAPADPSKLTISMTNTGGASWAKLPLSGGGYGPNGELDFGLTTQEQTQVTQFAATTLDPQVQLLRRMPLSSYVPDQHALTGPLHWQAGEMPALPGNLALAGEPVIWPLSDALAASVAGMRPDGAPYTLQIETPSPTGSSTIVPAQCCTWATMVNLRIARPHPQSGAPVADGIYTMLGADQTGADQLLAVLQALENAPKGEATLYLLYQPNQSSTNARGYISDAPARAACRLLKTNLSTLTHGTSARTAALRARREEQAESDTYFATLENQQSAEFVRLLWQCSIVRSGGFYLTYRTADGNALPAAIFGNDGEASISLLVTYKSQLSSAQSLLRSINNVAIVADNVDPSRSTLFALATVYQVKAGDTLALIAPSFASVNATPASLAVANANIANLLRPGASMAVPNGPDHVIVPGDTFASVAGKGGDIGVLGTLNASRDILTAEALLQGLEGELRIKANLLPGNTGFELTRTNPQAHGAKSRASGDGDPQQEVDTLFNLLGFQVTSNGFYDASGQGLPAGPLAKNPDDTQPFWRYSQTFRSSLFAQGAPLAEFVPDCPALPQPKDNPYAGIAAGSLLQLALWLQDVHGNRATPGTPVGPLSMETRYTDELLNFARWPAVNGTFAFEPVKDANPNLLADWAFSCSRYMPSLSTSFDLANRRASSDALQYAGIYYQVRMPDVAFALATSLGTIAGDQAALATQLKLDLVDLVSSAYVFLSSVAALPPVTYRTQQSSDSLLSVAQAYGTLPGAVAAANASADLQKLFGTNAQIAVPCYYRFRAGDTFTSIVDYLLPNGTPEQRQQLLALMAVANAKLPLATGTAMTTKTRTATVTRTIQFASVAAISQNSHVAVLDGAGGITGLASANGSARLTKGIVLTLNDATLTVGDSKTLADIVQEFAQSVRDASAQAVANANQYVQRFFDDGVKLTLENYTAQPQDTLQGIADSIGPVTPPPSGENPVISLLNDNKDVPDLFPAGTMLFYGTQSYSPKAEDTFASIADQFAVAVQDLGARNAPLPLLPDVTLELPGLLDSSNVQYSTYRADGSETFADIAGLYAAWKADPIAGAAALAVMNAHVPALFDTVTPIVIGTTRVVPTLASTFTTLAQAFSMDVGDFAKQIASRPKLVRSGAVLYGLVMSATAGQTLGDVSKTFHCTPAELADANASVYGFVSTGQSAGVAGYAVPVQQGDTFTSLAAKINAALAADGRSPWVSASDVGQANPKLKVEVIPLLSPVRAVHAGAGVTPQYTQAIAPVNASLTMTRDTALVDVEFVSSTPVYQSVATLASAVSSSDANGSDPSISLRAYAEKFEQAFPGLKLATGEGSPALSLFAVNLGTNGAQSARFNYAVSREGVQFYALPPLTHALWDSQELTLQEYQSGTGLTGSFKRLFRASEPDQWASALFSSIDALLSPADAANLQAFDADSFDSLVALKGQLAKAIKDDLQTVLGPASTTVASGGIYEAKEALYQQLLVELGDAYRTNVLVQYPFDVASGATDPDVAPRLSGKPLAQVYRTPKSGAVNVSDVAAALGVETAYLAGVLAAATFVINPDIAVSFGGKPYTTTSTDTLNVIASFYGTDVADLVAGITVVTPGAGLLRRDVALNVTIIRRTIATGDTFLSLANAMGVTVGDLISANLHRQNVFAAGSQIELQGKKAQVPQDGAPSSTAAALSLDPTEFGMALWSADLASSGSYTLNTGAKTPLTVLHVAPAYTFTTGKVPLADGTRFGTFLFDVKDAQYNPSVFLDLSYAITEVEYDIKRMQQTQGDYEESSWLTFPIPIEAGSSKNFPNDGNFGVTQIPVPLRAYPQPFALSTQTAEAQSSKALTADASLFEWHYAFGASRPSAAQDGGVITSVFNCTDGSSTPTGNDPSPRELLFQRLAQYAFVQHDLAADLELLAVPSPDEAQKKRIASAVPAFLSVVKQIADAWPQRQVRAFGEPVGGDRYSFAYDTIVDPDAPGQYRYLRLSYQEGPADYLFSVPSSLAGDLDAGNLQPLQTYFQKAEFPLSTQAYVDTETPGTAWSIVDPEENRTYSLALKAGASEISVANTYLWPKILDMSGKEPVELAMTQVGSQMLYTYQHDIDQPLNFSFVFERLQVIGKQNAWSGASVTRNAQLVSGRSTRDAFVYRTPIVYFASMITPQRLVEQAVSLREYLPPGKAALADALGGFFGALFEQQAEAHPNSTRNIKVAAQYQFDLGGSAAGFPLLLVPQHPFDVSTDNVPGTTPASFVDSLSQQTTQTARSTGAPDGTGRYSYDLTVYSTIPGSDAGRPLIQFSDLFYELE